MKNNKDHDYQMIQSAAFEIMRESLIDFYLKNRNFEAIKELTTNPQWPEIVMGEKVNNWIWVEEDIKGDYFIPSHIYNTFIDEAIKYTNPNDAWQWNFHSMIKDYIEHGEEKMLFPLGLHY